MASSAPHALPPPAGWPGTARTQPLATVPDPVGEPLPAAAVEVAGLLATELAGVLALLGAVLVAGVLAVEPVLAGGAELVAALVAGWLAVEPVPAGVDAVLCRLVRVGAGVLCRVAGVLGPGVVLPPARTAW